MKNKDYYCLRISKEHTEIKSNAKWVRDLQIDETSLKPFFSRVKNVCKDNKLREFYFKLLNRIVVNKKELFLFGIEDNSKCRKKENSTSSLSPIESIFGNKLDNKIKGSNIIRKLNFTFLHANYYLCNQKLLHGELSVKELTENLKFRYIFETFHVYVKRSVM